MALGDLITSCECVSTAIGWSKWFSKINSVWLVDWESDEWIRDSAFIEIVWTNRIFERGQWSLSINILTAQRRSLACLCIGHIAGCTAISIGWAELWSACSFIVRVVYAGSAVGTLIYYIVSAAIF